MSITKVFKMAFAKPLELLEYPKTQIATTWPVTASVMAQKVFEMKQWTISSKASGKPVECSTTTLSSLSSIEHGKKGTSGRQFFLDIRNHGYILYTNKFKHKGGLPMAERKLFVSRGELKDAYERLGALSKVADKFGVSKKLILNYMKKFNIKRNQRANSKDTATAIRSLAQRGKTTAEIAKTLNRSGAYICKVAGNFGISITNKYHKGFITTDSGYIMVKAPGEHPDKNSKGYVREHRFIMENYIGRYLTEAEVVHHINGNTGDNRLENLRLMRLGDHISLHHKGKKGRGPDKKPRKLKI